MQDQFIEHLTAVPAINTVNKFPEKKKKKYIPREFFSENKNYRICTNVFYVRITFIIAIVVTCALHEQ